MKARRTLAALAVAGCVIPLLTACAGRINHADELKAIIARTQARSRQFTYVERHANHTAKVTGTVQDDLRYKVDFAYDGQPAISEVMADDTRALRVNPAYVQQSNVFGSLSTPVGQKSGGNLAVSGQAGHASPSPSPSAAPELQVANSAQAYAKAAPDAATVSYLQQGQWVKDPHGAGPLGKLQQTSTAQLGIDQIGDALGMFRHVLEAIDVPNAQVVIYNPEAIDYRRDLDPFPAPGDGVLRYDVVAPPPAPRAGTTNTAAQQRISAIPTPPYFRSISVYVRDGYAFDIRESVNVLRRLVHDPNQDILARIGDAGIPVSAALADGSPQAQARYIVTVVNQIARVQANPQLREREVELQLQSTTGSSTVDVPDGTVSGNLAGIMVRGQVLDQG